MGLSYKLGLAAPMDITLKKREGGEPEREVERKTERESEREVEVEREVKMLVTIGQNSLIMKKR